MVVATAKRLAVLMGMLAVVLGTLAVPAMAQEEGYQDQYADEAREIVDMGVIEQAGPDGGYVLTDGVGTVLYGLTSAEQDFGAYAGKMVTVWGTLLPAGEGEPYPALDVTRIERVYGPGDRVAATFELAVEGEPPAGTTFFGQVGSPGDDVSYYSTLKDPDGDGTYVGSADVSLLGGTGPGGPTYSVAIRQGDPAAEETWEPIRDFGQVRFEEGETYSFSASVSFDGDGAPTVSGDTNDVPGGGVPEAGGNEGTKTLPFTGGVLPVAAAVGALLIAGGLISRRVMR